MLSTAGEEETNSEATYSQWTPTYGHTNVGWLAKVYIHQLCVDTGYSREDLSRGMDSKWESSESVQLAQLNDQVNITCAENKEIDQF